MGWSVGSSLLTATTKGHRIPPPIPATDGAARILDPILEGVKHARGEGGQVRTGVLLRNFFPVCW